MEVLIRKALYDDYPDLERLSRQLLEYHANERPDIFKTGVTPISKKRFDSILDNDVCNLYLIEYNNEVIGYLLFSILERNTLIFKESKEIFIEDFYLLLNYRHLGIGKKVVNFIDELAQKLDINGIELNVWEFNQDAIGFYNHLGFKTMSRRIEKRFK